MKKNKKFVILLGDGMADFPIDQLGNKTPMEAADTPNMDFIAEKGISGLARTIPPGMHPGSDVANLSIFGYDPAKYFTGRAPLEALSMGVKLNPDDVAFRCNTVTLDKDTMKDFSAGHISTEYSKLIIDELSRKIRFNGIEFHPGVSYRNLLVWRDFPYEEVSDTTPPHDIIGKEIGEYMPSGNGSDRLVEIMKESVNIINEFHMERSFTGKHRGNPNSVWLWGGGRRPTIKTLNDLHGLSGHTISAVDLIHGIGIAAGLTPLTVSGATGYIDTDYDAKTDALLRGIKNSNFIYLHVESPDESGHEGNLNHKLKSIEDFDTKVVGPVLEGLKIYDDFTVLVMPDHPTPLKLRTHTNDPVPFCLYSSHGFSSRLKKYSTVRGFNEEAAAGTGLLINEGHRMIEFMINNELF